MKALAELHLAAGLLTRVGAEQTDARAFQTHRSSAAPCHRGPWRPGLCQQIHSPVLPQRQHERRSVNVIIASLTALRLLSENAYTVRTAGSFPTRNLFQLLLSTDSTMDPAGWSDPDREQHGGQHLHLSFGHRMLSTCRGLKLNQHYCLAAPQ